MVVRLPWEQVVGVQIPAPRFFLRLAPPGGGSAVNVRSCGFKSTLDPCPLPHQYSFFEGHGTAGLVVKVVNTVDLKSIMWGFESPPGQRTPPRRAYVL
jgi:hypothetical protein